MAATLESATLSVTTGAVVKRALAIVDGALTGIGHAIGIVTGKTFGASCMVRKADEPLFPCRKELLSSPGKLGVAIVAAKTLGRVQFVVEDHLPVSAAAIDQSGKATTRIDRSWPHTEQQPRKQRY
jgi:hypothetical protein